MNIEHAQKAVDLMIDASRVLFFGVGFSGLSALEAQYRFTCLDLNCDCPMDPHFASMTASTLGPSDLAVFFSQTGSTKDVADYLDIAKSSRG